ncbi:DEAD/DEAH box helicase family protein [Burkholderia plantarii]|uniref:Terminase, large subunit n=1 Tax=Burkholderia plantarii TaxID=41899 RepID=A0A0B6RS41_BURPL|nr:DEAD/DEAH box helicase family protein [Burkholderia plantarii]AJK46208.1 terminase, large subunit [Burkholderia plantarii]
MARQPRKKNRNLLEDPRYGDFVERYHANPQLFAVEVTGFEPSADQEALFREITDPDAKVSVVSGTGTGKTAAFARIALWHLLCFPVAVYDGKVEVGSNTYIGAPFIQQVADGIWKEMQDARIAIASGAHAWINDYFTITKTRVHVNNYAEQWFITQIAMKKGEAIGVAGKHRYWQLIIIDEAAGVPDGHFDVIDGTQTQPGNRTLMASQGARNAGRFYDSHHTLKLENGGSWRALRFNSEYSPFVTSKWLRDRADESGGRTSVEYQIRVLGLFAQSSSNVLLMRADLEAAFEPRKIIGDDEPFGLIVLSDVALGEYRDDSVAVVAKIIGDADTGPDARRVEYIEIPIAANDKNEIDLAGDLVNLVGKLSNATLYVDAGGVGVTVCKLIERSGATVKRVNWGAPCFKNEYKTRFYNLRACAMVRFRDAIRQGRVVLPQGISKRLREKIIDQGSRLPYHFSEAGGLRYVMMAKEEMRRQGIKSPDLIDAMSFAFLENVAYVASGGAENALGGLTDAVVQQTEAIFADLE